MLFEKPIKADVPMILPWDKSQCICGKYGWLKYDRTAHFILGIAFGVNIGLVIAWVM